MTTIAAERVTNPASGAAKARERPILFSSEMVKAILDGRKTMTRRVVKPQPKTAGLSGVYADLYHRGPEWAFWLPDRRMTEPRTWPCPFGQPGDRLWVRETWAIRDCNPLLAAIFRADCVEDDSGEREGWWMDKNRNGDEVFIPGKVEWRPSIFMPRWASRITLEITAVRVERVQDITEEDAWAEGIRTPNPVAGFMLRWEDLNLKRGYGWDANPWAWVITFRRLP